MDPVTPLRMLPLPRRTVRKMGWPVGLSPTSDGVTTRRLDNFGLGHIWQRDSESNGDDLGFNQTP